MTSLPILFMSGQHSKEASNVYSFKRACSQYVNASASSAFGHECLSHGPLFSSLEKLIGPRRRPGEIRWSLQNLHFTALLMIYASDEALQDRFRTARDCVVEM